MKNKYYTPELSEFHVGFEFEVELNNGEWEKIIFNPTEEGNFLHRFTEEEYFTEEGHTRVKYLDKDDIENFGFKKDGDYGSYSLFYCGIWTLEHHPKKNIVDVWNDMGNSENSFRGVIKNKSELERVLKQIGVL